MVADWMKWGESALKAENYQEAYEYFSKVLEIEPMNLIALVNKGKAAGLQTTYKNSRVDEFVDSLKKLYEFTHNTNLSDDQKKTLIIFHNESILSFFETLLPKIKAIQDHKDQALEFSSDPPIILNFWNLYIEGANLMTSALKLLKQDNEPTLEYSLEYKKAMAKYFYWLCQFTRVKEPRAKDGIAYTTIEDDFRKQFVSDYDNLIDDIRRFEPDFHKGIYIDRLAGPSSSEEALERYKVLEELEAERQQQKYWENHPEEYKAYLLEEEKKKQQELAEQKGKEEELANQKRIEINEKFMPLETQQKELNEKIENLKIERSQLGLFAGKTKKELDAKVEKLTRANTILQNEIKELQKQLKSVDLKLRN
jgi:hypothetical protein